MMCIAFFNSKAAMENAARFYGTAKKRDKSFLGFAAKSLSDEKEDRPTMIPLHKALVFGVKPGTEIPSDCMIDPEAHVDNMVIMGPMDNYAVIDEILATGGNMTTEKKKTPDSGKPAAKT